MKSLFSYIILLLMFSNGLAFGQKLEHSIVEKLSVVTDRDVFCVNENIRFKIQQNMDGQWSKVVNIDVVSPDGQIIVAGKFAIENQTAFGSLLIPKQTLSGNYYLRAYTKWMKNRSPYSYTHQVLTIINPFTESVLEPMPQRNQVAIDHEDNLETIDFSINKNQFTRNSKAALSIQLGQGVDAHEFSVAIIKKGSREKPIDLVLKSENNEAVMKYIPETRGISISGQVVNQLDSLPVSFAKVWVTLMLPKRISKEALANENGEFNIDLGREHGTHDVVVQASTDKKEIVPLVRVDNDYSLEMINLPFVPLSDDPEKNRLYNEMSIQAQLGSLFSSSTNNMDSIENDHVYFYGKPDYSVVLDDFISLPTLDDYINELLPNIRIVKRKKLKTLQFISTFPELNLYDPLIMVDMLNVYNHGDVFQLSPKQLDRIEVVAQPYLRGDMIYGGIIHFVTKGVQLNEIGLKEESMLIAYDMEGLEKEVPVPMYESKHTPFLSNTLYWQPDIKLNSITKETIQFHTGSEPGVYEICIQGISKEGKRFYGCREIEID